MSQNGYGTSHYITLHYITFSQALKIGDKQSSARTPASSFGRGHRHAAYLGPLPDAPARVTATPGSSVASGRTETELASVDVGGIISLPGGNNPSQGECPSTPKAVACGLTAMQVRLPGCQPSRPATLLASRLLQSRSAAGLQTHPEGVGSRAS